MIQQLVLIGYQQLNLGSTMVSLAFIVVPFLCLRTPHYTLLSDVRAFTADSIVDAMTGCTSGIL